MKSLGLNENKEQELLELIPRARAHFRLGTEALN